MSLLEKAHQMSCFELLLSMKEIDQENVMLADEIGKLKWCVWRALSDIEKQFIYKTKEAVCGMAISNN